MAELLTDPDSPDWYARMIEEPVRDLVRLLRNSGVNTTCSCGHEMYIEAEWRGEDMYEIYQLVSGYVYDRDWDDKDFRLEGSVVYRRGFPYWRLRLNLNQSEHG